MRLGNVLQCRKKPCIQNNFDARQEWDSWSAFFSPAHPGVQPPTLSRQGRDARQITKKSKKFFSRRARRDRRVKTSLNTTPKIAFFLSLCSLRARDKALSFAEPAKRASYNHPHPTLPHQRGRKWKKCTAKIK